MKKEVPGFRFEIDSAELSAVMSTLERVVRSGRLTLGDEGRQFEDEFARTIGVQHACAVSSGTSALEIALRIFGVRAREVLVPANTFFATAAAVVHAGGRPRFVDCNPKTLSVDLVSVRKTWTQTCAGLIVVHIGGAVLPEIEEIAAFCREKGMFLLEDAAHAHGSTFQGKNAGSFGDAAAFSFYPTKVMTSGEGGMLVTSNPALDREARIYRDQGKESFSSNFHIRMGHNWRLSELHSVLGRSQLRTLQSSVERRREVARWYDRALDGVAGVQPQRQATGSSSNYYKYPVIIPTGVDRAALKQRIRDSHGVTLSGEVYQLPLHQQPVFKEFTNGPLPGAEAACANHICLPLYPGLTGNDVSYVAGALAAELR